MPAVGGDADLVAGSGSFSIIRLAQADAAVMRAAIALFGDAFDDPETYGGALPSDSYLAALLGREDFIALVATVNETVVGALTAYVLPKIESERPEVYIYDLAVASTHRRQGIATALVEAIRPVARVSGASVIYVQADLEDQPAIELYSKLGLRKAVLHFDIDV